MDRERLLRISQHHLALAAEFAAASEDAPLAQIRGVLGIAIPDGELIAGGDALMNRRLDRMRDMGVRFVRSDIRQGVSLALVDRWVRGCQTRGIKVLGLLNGGSTETPALRSSFAQFAASAVRQVGDHVTHWEVLNEPNLTRMTPEAYAELLKEVSAAIKVFGRHHQVLTSGNASVPRTENGMTGAADWLERLYRAGAGASFDAVAHHPYSNPLYPSSTQDYTGWNIMVRRLRPIMEAHGDAHKQIWITETGAPTQGRRDVMTEANAAENLRQTIVEARKLPWIGAICAYSLDDRGGDTTQAENWFGLCRPDGTEKPSCAVFRQHARQ